MGGLRLLVELYIERSRRLSTPISVDEPSGVGDGEVKLTNRKLYIFIMRLFVSIMSRILVIFHNLNLDCQLSLRSNGCLFTIDVLMDYYYSKDDKAKRQNYYLIFDALF